MVKEQKRRMFDKLGKIITYQPKGKGWFEYEPVYKGYHDREGLFHKGPISQTKADEMFCERLTPDEIRRDNLDRQLKEAHEDIAKIAERRAIDERLSGRSIVGKRLTDKFKIYKKRLPKE